MLTYVHGSLHPSGMANTDNYLLIISIIIVFELVNFLKQSLCSSVFCFEGERGEKEDQK